MRINPLLLVDSYKVHHKPMYPDNMSLLYSNLTPRKSRMPGVEKVVVFGLQHMIKDYLIERFNKDFFYTGLRRVIKLNEENPKKDIFVEMLEVRKKNMIIEYKRHNNIDTTHIEELFDLGYLPIEIKALPEGEQFALSLKSSNCWEA